MTLTDRYVAATLSRTPAAQRGDVEADLRAAIADAIEARLEAGEFADSTDPASAAETAVLNAMGDPEALAATYADRPLHLIGPRLYLQWKRLTVLLLSIVVPIVAVVVGIATAIDDESAATVVGTALEAAWTTAIMIGFWVTVVFAVLDRASQKEIEEMTTPWTVERMPTVPEAHVSWSDTVGSSVALAVTAALIIWQQYGLWWGASAGQPIINPELWAFTLPALLALMVIELVTVIARHARGHWTMRDWWVSLALNVATAALLAPSMLGGTFLNTDRFDELGWPDEASPLSLEQFQTVLWISVLVVVVADIVTGWRRARHAPR
ncbi:HAAS signaling domain-containing protein [Demequina muriae]|uniref:ABC-2 type transport system permease protein n=1 Tax=Demequina muriae TaxID=3051664 RepID=A0ABT8GFP6_9MICO|nr:hypothetical protein [Demequina sp. EGI L300058]MDN4479761.1 hypothetical protein [Demequina sp. EGI L300058]